MMLNCDEVAERLYSYLDRELSPEEMAAVQRHLNACPPCRRWFVFEENILRFVGECARRVRAPEELAARIRELRQP